MSTTKGPVHIGLLVLIAAALAGCEKKPAGSDCGDGVVEGSEACDGSDLAGETCASRGFLSGSLACAGDCTFDESGCSTTCGDNVLDPSELCDGTALDDNDCTTIETDFVGGELGCNATCDGWDTSQCRVATCGDGVAEGDEVCDGADLRNHDCGVIGQAFGCGTLACASDCMGWDTSGCILPEATCGDGVIEGPCEVCDGTNFAGQTCADFGYSNGFLVCHPRCGSILIHGCHNLPWSCGDGVAQFEQCDGDDLQGNTCESAGFPEGGTTGCTDQCRADVSGCEGDWCAPSGDFPGYYNDGWCDPCEFLGGVPDEDCMEVCFEADGECTSWFSFFMVSSCLMTVGVEDPDCGCGNGVLEPNHFEDCDGDQFREESCFEAYPGFAEGAGELRCEANCNYDLSGCVPSEQNEVTCDDGIDNDIDGAVDCADADCDGQPCSGGLCTAGVCQ